MSPVSHEVAVEKSLRRKQGVGRAKQIYEGGWGRSFAPSGVGRSVSEKFGRHGNGRV